MIKLNKNFILKDKIKKIKNIKKSKEIKNLILKNRIKKKNKRVKISYYYIKI
jgi:hypothetical protein